MTQPPLTPAVEEWMRKISELPTRSDDVMVMAVKSMAAVLSRDHEQIQRALSRFDVELSLSRRFDRARTDARGDLMNLILDGLPFILRELVEERGRVREAGEMTTQAREDDYRLTNLDPLIMPMESDDVPYDFPNLNSYYDENFQLNRLTTGLNEEEMLNENAGMDYAYGAMNNSLDELLSIRELADVPEPLPQHEPINAEDDSIHQLLSTLTTPRPPSEAAGSRIYTRPDRGEGNVIGRREVEKMVDRIYRTPEPPEDVATTGVSERRSERRSRLQRTVSKPRRYRDEVEEPARCTQTPAKKPRPEKPRARTPDRKREKRGAGPNQGSVAATAWVPPECVRCTKQPATPYSYMNHLYSCHDKSSLTTEGIYIRCACGTNLTSRTRTSERHNRKCTGRQFTVHKL